MISYRSPNTSQITVWEILIYFWYLYWEEMNCTLRLHTKNLYLYTKKLNIARKLCWALDFKHPYQKIVKAVPNNCWAQLRGQLMWGAIPYITFLHSLCLRGFVWEKLQADSQNNPLWPHCKRIDVIPFVLFIYFSWCSRHLNVVRCNTGCLCTKRCHHILSCRLSV